MELISVEEYQKNVEPALMKVFKDCIFPCTGATSCPFQDSIKSRAFLFAASDNAFYENPIFWNALSSAIIKSGDTEVFEIDTLDDFYRKYSLSSEKSLPEMYSPYRVICSLQGNWGLLFDIDGLSLLGGSTSFINNIRKSFPEIDQQIYYYFKYVKQEIEWYKKNNFYLDNLVSWIPDWLPDTLIHIYGEKKAQELLNEARKIDLHFNFSTTL
jgi:hypothetical protein